jgi:periplasmic divalent cation tolerance protein
MICLIHTMLPTTADATRMAEILLAERLIACANIIPGVQSLYRWEGAVQNAPEVMLQLKTSLAHQVETMARVASLHPFTTPAIWASRADGWPGFTTWVEDETKR